MAFKKVFKTIRSISGVVNNSGNGRGLGTRQNPITENSKYGHTADYFGHKPLVDDKKERIRTFRKEASRKAAVANKRIERLEARGLKDSPAYKALVENGKPKFGVRGKSYNQVQQELSRINKFLDAKTSTITGINSTLKEIATNTGIKYKNLTELRSKSAKFFELSSKVEQYLRTVEDIASAVGYQKIWEAINVYTQKNRTNLSDSDTDVDDLVDKVSKALTEYEEPIPLFGDGGWYSIKGDSDL